jgi:hypothetical protein
MIMAKINNEKALVAGVVSVAHPRVGGAGQSEGVAGAASGAGPTGALTGTGTSSAERPGRSAGDGRPSWAGALGVGVLVVAPAAPAPGHGSPGASVQGEIDAFNSGVVTDACPFYPPSAQAACRTQMAGVAGSSHPFVKVDGSWYDYPPAS